MKKAIPAAKSKAAEIRRMINAATALFHSGKAAEAEVICQHILGEAPKHVDALILLGVLKGQAKDFERSLSLLDHAIALQPRNLEIQEIRRVFSSQSTQARISEAQALHQRGDFAAAERIYLAVLALDPCHFDALQLMGALEAQRKNHQSAIDHLDRALRIKPDQAEVHFNRGVALGELKRFDEALASYDQALRIKPGYAGAYHNRGIALQALGRFDEALADCDQALRIKPDYAEAYNNRGNALHALRRFDEALVSYDQALRIKPDYAEAYGNRGSALQELKRLPEGLASYEQALRIKPDYAQAYSNRGFALQVLNRFDEALASCDQALRIQPDYAEAHFNRGVALHKLKRLPEALASYDQALRIEPDFAGAHLNQSLCHLLRGDYAKGWGQYEWRWKSERRAVKQRHAKHPLWLGSESIAGKAILLWFEQGFGDTLQFCRYARSVAELGATVYLEVPRALNALLTGLAGVEQVFSVGDALPEFDFQCPMLSLPLALKADERTISGAPYISVSAPNQWVDEVLNGLNPRIGVAWSGNADQENDHNRSMAFSKFQSLLPRGLDVVCLQKDIREADRAMLAEHPAIRAVDAHLTDFSDTAALINELDLVVTVDTSTAHLAGAMGKEVWILLSWDADWRWLLDRTDSPWYDSATLFRQPALGDWDSVLAEVKRRLCERYAIG
jgi:tetratricopeptide (TPR) repeat protein